MKEGKRMRAWWITGLLWICSIAGALPAAAQNFDKVEIKTEKLAGGIYMLTGSGGNIGLGVGEDAVFLIDDQYAPLTPKIVAAIAALTPQPVKFVLNTHWHMDHVGGNENLGKTGALIVAHENVRRRMSSEQFIAAFKQKVEPSPKIALPVVTFAESVSFHLNGDEIDAFHVARAHTDGDAVVYFHKANVVHMGDVFFNGYYPFIDLSSGGSINGTIAAVDRVLPMIDDNTKVIPGHGPLSDKAGLAAYRKMLAGIRDRVQAQLSAGKSLQETIAANPSAEFDEAWGKGYLKPAQFVETVYRSLSGR
jgi:glyoxylase-like metal-dependent hydrolase (beta-lactamase superfamily II)